MYFAYVVENPKAHHYTGSTGNVNERLEMHNDITPEKARFHRTTYRKGPWKLIFKKEFKTREEALKFEKFLKTGAGRRWLERARPPAHPPEAGGRAGGWVMTRSPRLGERFLARPPNSVVQFSPARQV